MSNQLLECDGIPYCYASFSYCFLFSLILEAASGKEVFEQSPFVDLLAMNDILADFKHVFLSILYVIFLRADTGKLPQVSTMFDRMLGSSDTKKPSNTGLLYSLLLFAVVMIAGTQVGSVVVIRIHEDVEALLATSHEKEHG